MTVAPTFREAGGQVVLEAEHFSRHITRSNRAWLTQTTLSGYAGSSYVSTLPDTGQLFIAVYTTRSPELQYGLTITATGIYTLWLRGYAPDGAGDSLYLGLEKEGQMIPLLLTGLAPRQWDWTNREVQSSTATIDISESGFYTLHIWQREDGVRIDRILLSRDNAYNPSGQGPAESELR